MEYLKAWIFLQYTLKQKGEEVDETLLKYVEKMYDQVQSLFETKLVSKDKAGNFELAKIADMQIENREMKNEVDTAYRLLYNSTAFISTMNLNDYIIAKKDFLKRNKPC